MAQRRKKKRTNDDVGGSKKRTKAGSRRKTLCGSRKRTKADSFKKTLRVVQQETNCSTKTLVTAIKLLRPFFENIGDIPLSFKGTDSKLLKKACRFLKLHGCVGCNHHVFLPSDKAERCPRCRFPRFRASGGPNEVCGFPRFNTHSINTTLMCRHAGIFQ